MVPFLLIEFNCLKAAEPLQKDNLLLTTYPSKFPDIHLINLRRMTRQVNLATTQWVLARKLQIWNPAA